MYSRQDYLNHQVSLEEYYGQFVTDYIKRCVQAHFGIEMIACAYQGNRYFDNIPLNQWDAITLIPDTWNKDFQEKMLATGDFISLGTRVWVLKEAARQLVEERNRESR